MTQAIRRTKIVVDCQTTRKLGAPIDYRARERHGANAAPFVRHRMLFLEAPIDDIELRLGVFQRHARTELSDDVQIIHVAAGRELRVEPERSPELGAVGIIESFPRHAHHFVRFSVEAYDVLRSLPDRLRTGAETAGSSGPRS